MKLLTRLVEFLRGPTSFPSCPVPMVGQDDEVMEMCRREQREMAERVARLQMEVRIRARSQDDLARHNPRPASDTLDLS